MAVLVITAQFGAFSYPVKADTGVHFLNPVSPSPLVQQVRSECAGRNFDRSRRYDDDPGYETGRRYDDHRARYPENGPCDPYSPRLSRRDRDDWEDRRESRDARFIPSRRRDRRDIEARDERRDRSIDDEYCGSACWYRRLKDGYCGHGCDYYVDRKR
ncbi:MAG: hypothetical protein SGJ17_02635 [Hyphomicrobiales bacterium]|nr:hypothetical protein [Hyphomicrobiales bacterium]